MHYKVDVLNAAGTVCFRILKVIHFVLGVFHRSQHKIARTPAPRLQTRLVSAEGRGKE